MANILIDMCVCKQTQGAVETPPHSNVNGANMEPIWGRQDPGGPHVGPMNFVIWVYFSIRCIDITGVESLQSFHVMLSAAIFLKHLFISTDKQASDYNLPRRSPYQWCKLLRRSLNMHVMANVSISTYLSIKFVNWQLHRSVPRQKDAGK